MLVKIDSAERNKSQLTTDVRKGLSYFGYLENFVELKVDK